MYTEEEVKALLKQQKELCYSGVKADISITSNTRAAEVVKSTPLVTFKKQS